MLGWLPLTLVVGAMVAVSASAQVSFLRDFNYALSQGWSKTPLLGLLITLGLFASLVGFTLLVARTTSRRERIV